MKPFTEHPPVEDDYRDIAVGIFLILLTVVLLVAALEPTPGGILAGVVAILLGLLIIAAGWVGTPDDFDQTEDTRRLRSFKSASRWTVYACLFFLVALAVVARILFARR